MNQNDPQKGIGDEFRSIQNALKNLKIGSKKREINILLLGETGVGKSTFINAFFNYISFSSLHKAKNQNLQVVIPTKFTITDENYQERVIQVGEDHNESIEVGASATQACRSYVYLVPDMNVKIRLIDTPGVGDTRGIDQDNVNFENVLSFISELKHLNAICILLKPNNSRLTVMFEFCIKQLLSRLEKSASKNLIFVFTNTRNTFYRPGETLPALKKLLETIKGVDILCEKTNIFCTDNEAFRFLAALKNEVEFPAGDVSNFGKSWSQSYKECLRMIKYIIGDDDNSGLIPHEVKNTISVNEARRLIVQLSQPLAEIAQLIQDNIRALDSHQMQLRLTRTTLSELRTKLYIPFVDLKVTKLTEPTTVCTSVKCSTVYQVGDKKKWHYHQRCHAPCYLRNVPQEIIGTPELIKCAAMNPNGECKRCSCRYQVHMHIYYVTETYENKLEDEMVKTTIVSKEETWQAAQNLILKMSQRVSALNKEKDTIIKTTAKFACFLKSNAIAPYNDAYEAYLKYLIDREKSMNEATDFEMIQQLERMLRDYTAEKTAIMNAISQAKDNTSVITADDIFVSIRSLYTLEMFGHKIKELFEVQRQARKDENKSQTKEYVYGGNFEFKNKGPTRGRGRGRVNQRNPQFHVNKSKTFQKNAQFTRRLEPEHFRGSNQYSNRGAQSRINVTILQSRGRDEDVMNYPSDFAVSQTFGPSSSMRSQPPPIYYPGATYPHHGFRQPPPLMNVHSQPPDYYSPNYYSEQPRQNRQFQGNDSRNILPQPYHSEPETSNPRRRRKHRKSNNKHNLHLSSSSDSGSEYFSSNDRRH